MNPEAQMDGILLVDKPTDWTSHDVCAFIKKRFGIKKVGHAGTLDPLATGLLVILLGHATKHSASLMSCDKDYAGVFELGMKTDSHDRQGKVIETASADHVTFDDVRQKALRFTGEIIQIPPMVSALKHKGVRLYELARRGIDVPREGRKVTVFEFRMEKKDGPRVYFYSKVSKGTYVRTLVNDLGEALGTYATLQELRRTRSGEFRIEDSVTIDQLRQWTLRELRPVVVPPRASYAHSSDT